MNLADIQALIFQQLGIAQTTELKSLIEALVDDVIADILLESEMDLQSTNDPAFVTVASTESSVAPAGFIKPIKIWKSDRTLIKLDSAEEYWNFRANDSQTGEPLRYYVMGRNSSGRRLIYWQPVPDGIYTYNLSHYLIPQGLTLDNVPDEWDLTIVAGVKKYLIELKPETLMAYTGAEAEYGSKLNKLLGLEQRPGDEGRRWGIDPAVVIKNRYVLSSRRLTRKQWPGFK